MASSGSRNLYDILELSQNASRSDIRAAYHRLAKLSHPDKNPNADPAVFHALQKAYETLSDPEKRAAYDAARERAASPRFAHHFDREVFEDLFTTMFRDDLADPFFSRPFARGSAGHRSWPRPASTSQWTSPKAQSPDSQLEFACSLEDLMNGRKITLEVHRQLGCGPCNGSGIRLNAPLRPCRRCDGQGFVFAHQSVHGMFTYSRSTCASCNGEGSKTSSRDCCTHCNGTSIETKVTAIEWRISKGMLPGHLITLLGMGDARPGCLPGDLIFCLRLTPHPTFSLVSPNSRDLILSVSITLSESLLGLDRVLFTHLDGRAIRVHLPSPHQPGHTVIKPGELRVIKGMGLPGQTAFELSGDLWIKFEVEWPNAEWVRSQDFCLLQNALPPSRPDFVPTLPAHAHQVYAKIESGAADERTAQAASRMP